MRVLDLFSGIGGFSLGLERAGMETAAFCEIDPFCQKVLNKHWPDVPIYDDVTELTYERLQTDGITDIDVICGGFPCQDISTAKTNNHINGTRSGLDGERSGLWGEYQRIIGEVLPEIVIVENVSALLSGDSGRWFGRILGDLAEIGYDCEWHCIPASAIGAPHRRERLWIVAYPHETQRKRGGISSGIHQELNNFSRNSWWQDKSTVQRVDDGIPRQMDRLGSIGNAVVPHIPEIIGRAIMEQQ